MDLSFCNLFRSTPSGLAGVFAVAPNLSEHCRTSARCQREHQIECQKECQNECLKRCQIECQNRYQIHECQKEGQNRCQIECQKECQRECQIECQSICQKECQIVIECQNKYAIYISRWYVRNYAGIVFHRFFQDSTGDPGRGLIYVGDLWS